jgi:hypothetical protein
MLRSMQLGIGTRLFGIAMFFVQAIEVPRERRWADATFFIVRSTIYEVIYSHISSLTACIRVNGVLCREL